MVVQTEGCMYGWIFDYAEIWTDKAQPIHLSTTNPLYHKILQNAHFLS